tara:strand:- start:290 stop:490 length:201 start_codon:yes stop_codon:yes gene_type:complete
MKYELGTTLTVGHERLTLKDCEVIGAQEAGGEETWLYTWSTQGDGRDVLTTGDELSAVIADGASLK